jgi:uncharacterized membrane protein HdeD (DUF308 family)
MLTEPLLAIVTESTRYWWLHLIRGLAALIFAIIAIAYPGITLLFLAVLVAVWAFIIGFSELGQAWRLRALRKRLNP